MSLLFVSERYFCVHAGSGLLEEPLRSLQQRESINLGCRCFDTGIVRSIKLYQDVGLLPLHAPVNVSFVMGVASGMPARSDLLPILLSEIQANVQWQVIAIGRRDIWDLHRRAIELGG